MPRDRHATSNQIKYKLIGDLPYYSIYIKFVQCIVVHCTGVRLSCYDHYYVLLVFWCRAWVIVLVLIIREYYQIKWEYMKSWR